MSEKYCKIFFEGKKKDIEHLMKDKDWKFELHEMDDKTLFCKINEEFYDELEFFKGLNVDELEITKILDIQEIDEFAYNSEVKAIKEKEEREQNNENDEREADNLNNETEKEKEIEKEKEKENEKESGSEKERVDFEEEKEKTENEGEKTKNEDFNNNIEDKEKEETKNVTSRPAFDQSNEFSNENKNLEEKQSLPKKQNIYEEKKVKTNIEPEEEKKYEKVNLKDVLLPSKNILDENDIMNSLLSKDFLIKFFVIASGVITFFCLFDK